MSTNEVAPDVAERNRTLRVSDDEARSLVADILTADDIRSGRSWTDSTIRGDMTEVLSCLPDEAFDLIILDPPYNLNKDFGTTRFRAASAESYQAYIESWLPTVCDKLKPTGSLYLCGEWRSSAVLQTVLMRHLTVINRITWQREKGRSAGRNWKNAMEDIWFAVKDEHLYYFNADAVKQCRRVRAPYRQDGLPKDWHETERGRIRLTGAGNFWDDLSVPFWSMPENTNHPTQKPEKLIAKLIDRYSSVPKLDIVNFWEQVVFSWIVGNADMHLKNFSLYSEKVGKYVLTPTYDQVSTAIVMPEDSDQLALPLNGFQKKLLSMDFAQAMELSGLNRQMVQRIFNRFIPLKEKWFACIDASFVSEQQKTQFKELISNRIETLSMPF